MSYLVLPCLLLLGCTAQSNAQSGNERLSWILGPQGKGDCNEICKRSIGKQCSESLGRKAASDVDKVELYKNCKGRNSWDYGQGFSQCTDPRCCNDGSCQYACSLPKWGSCKVADGFASGHHSRICPCTGCPEYNVDYYGNDLGIVSYKVKKWEDCARECRNRNGCKFWTWIRKDDANSDLPCFLKKQRQW
eukprot:TRINITY_DN361_c0_g1_i1.p1 TRINITY_DN361_c0_g1~~TRINITY_DN361_c0_g1_i1.p1  ORF type:complete len:191 (-),score=31.02 TRINITY_DN361_c0_g1_i1:162-734(-)